MGAVYYTLSCFPPEVQKLPELMFTAMIFHSKIREVNSSKNIFLPFVEELLDLESKGINIELEGKNETIYFVSTLFFWGLTL